MVDLLIRSMRGRGLRVAAQAAIAGTLIAFGEPGVGCTPLLLLGLIALATLAARASSARAAAGIGAISGLSAAGAVTIAGANWGIPVAVALTCLGVALYAVPQALLAYWVSRHFSGLRAFVFVVATWSLCIGLGELIGFPMQGEALGAVASVPLLLSSARWFGIDILCGVMIAGSICCGIELARADELKTKLQRALLPLLASGTLLLVLGTAARLQAPGASASIAVGIPQMNVPSEYFKLRQAIPERRDAFEALFSEQVQALRDADLLVLSETYDGAFPLLVPSLRRGFESHARLQRQAVLITSYLVADDGGGYNAAGAINSEGELVGVHRKVDLAPFGERELESGNHFQPAAVLPGVRIGTLICQEAILKDGPLALVRAGANLLVTPTSDVSFGSGILSFEHLAGARLRALEVGRAMVWASAAGPSGVITRWGEFVQAAPFREVAPAKASAEIYDDRTLYLRSFWLWPLLSGVVAVALLLRGRTAVSEVAPTVTPLATWRGLVELTLALSVAVACAVGSPALVELRSGNPARAVLGIKELLGRAPTDLGPASLARFGTDAEQSASGALAYYLDFYGLRTLPSDAPFAQAPTFDQISRVLSDSFRFPARSVQLDFGALPRSATIVRSKLGEFGVLTSDRFTTLSVFWPTRSLIFRLTPQQASALLDSSALVPASDAELSRFPP